LKSTGKIGGASLCAGTEPACTEEGREVAYGIVMFLFKLKLHVGETMARNDATNNVSSFDSRARRHMKEPQSPDRTIR
jgi:hypothetical protein